MKVVSKLLTADVRITKVQWESRKLTVEGVVKEIMPMTVEMSWTDAREMARLAAAPLTARLIEHLPAAVRDLVGRLSRSRARTPGQPLPG